jgi:6-phosphofructokinase 1
MGGYSGYLATMAGLASGADASYIPEEKFGIRELTKDMDIIASKMEKGNIFRGVILMNEKANKNYDLSFLTRFYDLSLKYNTNQICFRMYTEEGKNHFTVRDNVLGHTQQGGTPSPYDRSVATKMAAKTVTWLVEQLNHFASMDGKHNLPIFFCTYSISHCKGTVHAETPGSATLLGMRYAKYVFQPIEELAKETDFEKR